MLPGEWNTTCKQGTKYNPTLTYKNPNGTPVNLTGYTARMSVKDKKEGGTELVSLTTTNGRITLGGSAGTIALSIKATDTATFATGVYYFDLELVPPTGDDDAFALVEGKFTVIPEITT